MAQPALPAWERPPERYPMLFDVAYPDRLSRWKTFFRLFLLVPVLLFAPLVQYFAYFAALIGFTTVFWRKKYPDWLFRGLSGAFGYGARVYAYALLVTDRFPSFAPEDNPVVLEFDQPPSGHLSRWRVFFWKSVLLIPHIVVLYFVGLAVFAVTVIAWFAILFTGNYPRGMFQFVVGVQRWWWRVTGYFVSFNDRFPPFALSAEAGPASNGAVVANGIIGGVLAGGFAALVAAAAAIQPGVKTAEVDYAQLQSGRQQPVHTFDTGFDQDVTLRLNRVVDPGDALIQVLRPASDERVVVFQWTVDNDGDASALVPAGVARLTYEEDGDRKAVETTFLGVNNLAAPARVGGSRSALVQAVFVIPEDAEPVELRFSGGFARAGVRYVFD